MVAVNYHAQRRTAAVVVDAQIHEILYNRALMVEARSLFDKLM